jgi:activator of 2-hydroxyglutaryl-CoA dehydratase
MIAVRFNSGFLTAQTFIMNDKCAIGTGKPLEIPAGAIGDNLLSVALLLLLRAGG